MRVVCAHLGTQAERVQSVKAGGPHGLQSTLLYEETAEAWGMQLLRATGDHPGGRRPGVLRTKEEVRGSLARKGQRMGKDRDSAGLGSSWLSWGRAGLSCYLKGQVLSEAGCGAPAGSRGSVGGWE